MTLVITALAIMSLGIMTLGMNNTQQNDKMLSVALLCCYYESL